MKQIIRISAFISVFLACAAVHAQDSRPSQTALQYASAVAGACPGRWESQPCLEAVSQSNLVLAANYMESLINGDRKPESELIKEHCAASTAATKGEFPAYALKSAFTECANTLSDVAEATGISPDLSQYQILVGAVLCMNGNENCAAVEEGLRSSR